ncbi:hypothetical protein GCM10008961_09470 [Deinococcus knuensis]|uniref:Uncharacterized protein n=1 Tax=Deinococcus knuensis TaxID=1837380 RepID=A0ABQ2SCH8_9DEIO|nr:hypothetical protein GCM10008961_09470 [Deinococcus knuensis]
MRQKGPRDAEERNRATLTPKSGDMAQIEGAGISGWRLLDDRGVILKCDG